MRGEYSIVFTLLLLPFVLSNAIPTQHQTTILKELGDYQRLPVTTSAGPESLAFDHTGKGPYAGVSDGRVLKWEGPAVGWVKFAVSSPNRKDEECDGSIDLNLEQKCGRPLGLKFHEVTGNLYIADAYYGLLEVGHGGGLATPLVTSAGGTPLRLTNAVDIDVRRGIVYVTDSSTQFQRRDYVWAVVTGDATGRVMSYSLATKKVTVLLKGLKFPNGLAVSKDGSFLLIAETTNKRILRHWVRGSLAGKTQVFAQLPSYPDNIKRNQKGEFWVALNSGNGKLINEDPLMVVKGSEGGDGEVVFQSEALKVEGEPVGIRFDDNGFKLEVLYDNGKPADVVSEVVDTNGTLWIGSGLMPYIGVYKH